MELLLAFALFILLDYAALRWGTDSRDGFADDRPPRAALTARRPGLF
jgi:hypothetical protein